jgi:tRNA uridine 5-carboxymethylaminomethyl modification enzyme
MPRDDLSACVRGEPSGAAARVGTGRRGSRERGETHGAGRAGGSAMIDQYDVIVIGGGHAGAEAAAISSRAGARTLLLTQDLSTIGQMSCNPAIGGIAKGTVVREVDALGGVMGRATDRARIQFRMLNRSKGPAVWSPRAQCDRALYRVAVRSELERLDDLVLAQGTIARLELAGGRVRGVVTTAGRRFGARSVVLTAGTFLRGCIHVGRDTRIPAGRAGDAPVTEIAEDIVSLGLKTERFKTGTPPRIDGTSVDYKQLQRQDGDDTPYWFSAHARASHPEQRPCWSTRTDSVLHQIIADHLGESALYGGAISGRGPRYCPSIEDKIVKFPSATGHQVFLEPEGLGTSEMYVNGLSTSLPPEVQLAFLQSVPGLQHVRMTRAGYAIEYDYFPPSQIHTTLEARAIPGLFLAGQVNGTTGYEEAAGQGALAGLNAALSSLDQEPAIIPRGQAFIGVMVDDLVTRGVDEPYRLFTSRSEFRLLLRQDNALRRMWPLIERYRLLTESELQAAHSRLAREDGALRLAESVSLDAETANPILADYESSPVGHPTRIAELARRPGVPTGVLLKCAGLDFEEDQVVWADLELKYAGYLKRERAAALRVAAMDGLLLPSHLEYGSLTNLSMEARERLAAVRPTSLGQAGRLPGVAPSDVHSLLAEVLRIGERST